MNLYRKGSPTAVCLARVAPWLVLCLALGWRAGYAWDVARDPSDGYPMFHAVRGVPFSDAQTWDYCAAELADGRPIPAHWAARRPLYSVMLALVYVWTGPSFAVAVGLNVLAGALSITLLYLLGARMIHPLVGAATAVWAACDPLLSAQSVQIMSEAPGLTLLLLHLAVLLAAWRRGGWWLFAAGLLFAISNLTRMLSLLALPGLLVCVGLLWRTTGASYGRAAWAAGAVFAGVLLVLSPLLVRQWLGFGIVSLQDSTAAHLYAATSPQYGRYSSEIDYEANQRGLIDVAERYAYFMQRAKASFWAHPTFFFTNLARNTVEAWNVSVRWKLPWLTAVLAALVPWFLLAERAVLSRLRGASAKGLLMAVVASAILSALAWQTRHGQGLLAPGVVLLVAAWSVTFRRGEALVLCTNLALGTLLALGLFAYTEDRLLTMFQWVFVVQFFAAWVLAFEWTAGRWLGERDVVLPAVGPASTVLGGLANDVGWSRWQRPVLIAAAFALALSWNRLQWRRFEENWAPKIWPTVDATDAVALVGAAMELRPNLAGINVAETKPIAVEALAKHNVARDDGRWVAIAGRITRYTHYFPPGARTPNNWRQFHHRPYARTVMLFEGHGANRDSWTEFVVWPGPIAPGLVDQPCVLVGRVSAVPVPNQAFLVEGVAIFPLDLETGRPVVKSASFADHPEHQKFLEELARHPRQGPATDSAPGDAAAPAR